ncbi:ABC transporter permease [Zwartia vadi]|uniref:ABC transporter permease n=1 Tax=Zwartia vadi TaxID=3058168 RepID=UPI0025B3DE4C|nr:iron ABC transporter permease [Zwartia vadi]MDN3987748.1 iron ABC transporter permease [Zwartia vadi]
MNHTNHALDTVQKAPVVPIYRNASIFDGGRILGIIYLITFVVVALLVAIPLVALIYGSLRSTAPGLEGHWTFENWIALFSTGIVGTFYTTLFIGIASALIASVIGTAIAIVVHRTDFRGGSVVTALVSLSFFLPSFILAMAWIIIGSPGGLINGVLESIGIESLKVDAYTKSGMIFVTVLHQIPFVYLMMRGPILGIDATFEEAARASGATPFNVLRRVTLPLLSFSITSSLVLTFILSIEQFAIPALMGIPGRITVLATQLYLLVSFPPPDYGLAAAIGLTLSALTGLAIWVQRRIARGNRLTVTTGKAGRLTLISLGKWRWAANSLCWGYILCALILPVIILAYVSVLKYFSANPFEGAYTMRNYVFLFESSATLRSFWNTLIVSGLGAIIGVGLASFVSYFTLRHRPPGYRVLDFVASLPFGVPGVVIGLGLLWAYAYLPLPIYGTLVILIISFITRFLSYATETVGGRMVQIDKSLEEAAWTAGSTRLQGIKKILIPLAMPSLQGAYFLLFMAFFREIASAVLLYTASTSVLSTSIWSFFEQANWGLASSLSLVGMIVVFIAMYLLMLITKRRPSLKLLERSKSPQTT